MKVEIADDLYESLLKLSQERYLSNDATQLIEKAAIYTLRENCCPNYDVDQLTKCKFSSVLKKDIRNGLFGSSWTDETNYREKFACLDINNFKHYLDHYGLTAGDECLVKIGTSLIATYGSQNVYRFGGDEFVIRLGTMELKKLIEIEHITIKYTQVEFDFKRINKKLNHYCDLVYFILSKAIADSSPNGNILVINNNNNLINSAWTSEQTRKSNE